MKRRCYISGPMTGYPDFNYPAFNAAEKLLKAFGWDVINPTSNFNGDTGHKRSEYMRLDVGHVLKVDALFVLPGWEQSRGARVEVLVAQELGIPVYLFDAEGVMKEIDSKVVTYVR